MRLHELSEKIPGITLEGSSEGQIQGITYDSRQVKPGDLFVALKGEKTDGVLFAGQAAARGAAACAAESGAAFPPGIPLLRVADARRFLAEAARVIYGDPASRMRLVAITGTNGKTTTALLMEAIFRSAGLPCCVSGTLGMKIGDCPFPSAHTTPEASDLTAFLQQAELAGCRHGSIEVSSHALSLKRVFGMHFQVGVFSNLTPEHMDFHRDMEDYYKAKRRLFTPEGANAIGTAVINTDDSYGRRLAAEAAVPVLSYGFGPPAGIRVRESEMTLDGTRLRVSTPAGDLTIHSRLVGRPNTCNMLAAIGAALGLDVDPRHIRAGIESLDGVSGRMQMIRGGQDFTVIVDYAHTPDALEKLLETVRQLAPGHLVAVFGCGGDRDRRKRPLMGEIAARLSDVVVATSDNPRSENPAGILAEIEPGLMRGPASYQLKVDRREAIRSALSLARKGDVVVIAGKGHETYQMIGNQVLPFDDRTVALQLIHQLLNVQGD